MAARTHYTLRAKKDVENARDEEDAAAKIRGALGDHYDETCTIALQRRNPSTLKWEDVQVLDLVHEDPAGLTAEAKALEKERKPQCIAELAEDLIGMAESEAAIEGGARFRAIGRGERLGKPPLFEVPWIAGGPLLESERKLQAEDAKASALTSTTRALESAHRMLERTWRANSEMAEKAKGYHDAMVGNVTKVLETMATIEAPSLAAEINKADREKAKMAHDERMQEDRDSHELLLEALGVFGKALDADRRDKKQDRDAARRARGEVIDTDVVEPKNGEPKNGAPKNGAPDMRRPEVPRCAEARELLEVLDDLDEAQATKIRALLTAEEMAAVFAAADAATLEDFDRRFAEVDALWQQRGQVAYTRLNTELGAVLGLRGFALKSLVTKWERRNHGRPQT